MVLKDKKTRITFHSGVLTIGGTIIEVEYEESRLFFDFGSEFNPEIKLKNESYEELIENRLIPKLKNVYDRAITKENYSDNYKNTAVFISHTHLDHTRIVNFLDSEIPLYASNNTKKILNALNQNGDFILPSNSGFKTREIIGLDLDQSFTVGKIKPTLKYVDHDAFGASGLVIETPDMTIAYTGDLRLHGFDASDSLDFCKSAKDCDVLIIEGVSISFEERKENNSIKSEQELISRFCEIVNNNKGKQVTFNTYPANVKRLAAIIENSPRPVVCEAFYANILKKCLNLEVDYYSINEVNYDLDTNRRVNYEVLLQDENQYVWQVTENYENLKGGGAYIHSDATPLGDFDPNYQPFLELLDKNNINFNRVACTGHAFPNDLVKIVDLISPKLLVPIHSLHPEKLDNKHGMRHLPIRGETI